MQFYVKAVGTNITLVEIEAGAKFQISPTAVTKLLGVEMREGEVWEITVRRREDVEQAFGRWQVVQRV